MTNDALLRLLELLAHDTPAFRAQGMELLSALDAATRQAVFLRAVQQENTPLAIRVATFDQPVPSGWLTRRAWHTAAHHLTEELRQHDIALPPAIFQPLRRMGEVLSGPPTAQHRVAVGGCRLALRAALQEQSLPMGRTGWQTPAESIFQARDRLWEDALESSRHALIEALFPPTLRSLSPWSPLETLHSRAVALVLLELPTHPVIQEGAQRQRQARAASLQVQRQLCARLEQEQRALAGTLISAREASLRAWWSDVLRQLGASPESTLFPSPQATRSPRSVSTPGAP